MIDKVPLVVELCCGSAAFSLGLLGGRPPTTWLGGKSHYASTIRRVLGLSGGWGASQVILVEAGEWADVWRTLAASPTARAEVAQVLRGYDDGDDAALFACLREQWRQADGIATPADAARWLWLTHRSFGGKGPSSGYDTHHRPGSAARLADRVAGLPDLSCLQVVRGDVVEITDQLLPPGRQLPEGTICYFDPPYQATSRYPGCDLSRAAVVEVARRWSAAGATVCISEAEALPELLALGWHGVDITDGSSRRTFSAQQREFLTLSRPPDWVPPQEDAGLIEELFGCAPRPPRPLPSIG